MAEQHARVVREPPRLAIVTPSYNQAAYLAEAIESVLAQDYPHVDYLVMDGGSTDGSLEILRRYEYRLRYVHAPDGGQADAVRRGFEATRGEIFGFLNADDRYAPGAFATAVRAFAAHPQAGVVYGNVDAIDAAGVVFLQYSPPPFERDLLLRECLIPQPAAFASRRAVAAVGGIDASLRYALDYDLWLRLAARHNFQKIEATLAAARFHGESKTESQHGPLLREAIAVVRRHHGYVPYSWIDRLARWRLHGYGRPPDLPAENRRSRALALLLGAGANRAQPRRWLEDWRTRGWADFTGRWSDDWISRCWRTVVSVPANTGGLRISGSHGPPDALTLPLKVLLDGREVAAVTLIRPGPFRIDVELVASPAERDSELRLEAGSTWTPPGEDQRPLSCQIHAIDFVAAPGPG